MSYPSFKFCMCIFFQAKKFTVYIGVPFYVNVWIHLWSKHIHQLRFLSQVRNIHVQTCNNRRSFPSPRRSSWSYGSWITTISGISAYHPVLSPVKLWVWILLMYSKHHYVIEFVSDFVRFPPSIKLTVTRDGSRGGRTRRASPLKLEKIWFFCVKLWFFTRNTPKFFAPPSARRDIFMCAPPPNLKSWIRPW